MLKTSSTQKKKEVAFAAEYRELQRTVSRMRSDEPSPPCCYCTSSQIWRCCNTGQECSVFTQYCSDKDS